MLGYSWTPITAQGDGSALASSTTATSILPSASKFTLPANFLSIGTRVVVRAAGRVSTFTSGTLTLDVRFGSVIVATSQALTMVASQTNQTWLLDWDLTCRAIGGSTSANFMHIGRVSAAAAITAAVTMIPASAPAVGTGFDSTAAQLIDFFAKWSVSDAANSIQIHQFSIDLPN